MMQGVSVECSENAGGWVYLCVSLCA